MEQKTKPRMGRPKIPEGAMERLAFFAPPDIANKLRVNAERKRISVGAFIRELIAKSFSK